MYVSESAEPQRLRASQEVSLPVTDPEPAQQIHGRLITHALCHNLCAEPGRDLGHSFDDELIPGRIREVADEVPVDLHEIEVEVLQVLERGEGGPEIVEGEPAAGVAQTRSEFARATEVGDPAGLGQLDGQQLGRHEVGRQLLDDPVGNRRIIECRSGDIHRQRHRPSRL